MFGDSERSTYAWLCNDSGLSELLDFDFKKSSLDKLYQISDKLLNHKDKYYLNISVPMRKMVQNLMNYSKYYHFFLEVKYKNFLWN